MGWFRGLRKDKHSEADLHRGLLGQLRAFLIELGRDFCYVGSEFPLQVGGRDFALDLLFFHRGLNCPIRHSTATHMLSSGIDINTVRAWLGHASLETTNVYAEINLEGKARLLAACKVTTDKAPIKRWHADAGVMQFLRSR